MLKWEELSAFGDFGELEHVIYLLRRHAEFLRDSSLPRDHWAVRDNPFHFLRRQIDRQYHASRAGLRSRPSMPRRSRPGSKRSGPNAPGAPLRYLP